MVTLKANTSIRAHGVDAVSIAVANITRLHTLINVRAVEKSVALVTGFTGALCTEVGIGKICIVHTKLRHVGAKTPALRKATYHFIWCDSTGVVELTGVRT